MGAADTGQESDDAALSKAEGKTVVPKGVGAAEEIAGVKRECGAQIVASLAVISFDSFSFFILPACWPRDDSGGQPEKMSSPKFGPKGKRGTIQSRKT
ncbi:MAG TPA: hypothetical protein VGH51_12130 [Candidatus Angelobacter sp.]